MRCVAPINMHIWDQAYGSGMKPTWSYYITVVIGSWIWFAKVLVKILYKFWSISSNSYNDSPKE